MQGKSYVSFMIVQVHRCVNTEVKILHSDLLYRLYMWFWSFGLLDEDDDDDDDSVHLCSLKVKVIFLILVLCTVCLID